MIHFGSRSQQHAAIAQHNIGRPDETADGLLDDPPSGCEIEPSTRTRRVCNSITKAVP